MNFEGQIKRAAPTLSNKSYVHEYTGRSRLAVIYFNGRDDLIHIIKPLLPEQFGIWTQREGYLLQLFGTRISAEAIVDGVNDFINDLDLLLITDNTNPDWLDDYIEASLKQSVKAEFILEYFSIEGFLKSFATNRGKYQKPHNSNRYFTLFDTARISPPMRETTGSAVDDWAAYLYETWTGIDSILQANEFVQGIVDLATAYSAGRIQKELGMNYSELRQLDGCISALKIRLTLTHKENDVNVSFEKLNKAINGSRNSEDWIQIAMTTVMEEYPNIKRKGLYVDKYEEKSTFHGFPIIDVENLLSVNKIQLTLSRDNRGTHYDLVRTIALYFLKLKANKQLDLTKDWIFSFGRTMDCQNLDKSIDTIVNNIRRVSL